jgi:D-xylose transport system substrate-binding protein
MKASRFKVGAVAAILTCSLVALACSSSSKTTSTSGTTAGGGGNAAVVISVSSFGSNFDVMKVLKPLTAKGHGMVGVLLPDTQSSARYVDFDAPYLAKAFEAAGYTSSQFKVTNAQGSDATQQQQAEADITDGATVLLVDPLDSGVGATIESYAKSHGVPTIDYDRLTLGGSRSYYVSFNNVTVGKLIGQGLVDCITAWNVQKPQVFELDGAPTDNNATLFAQGYNGVLKPKYSAGTYTKVGEQAVPDWDNQQALTIFQQQYTAHPNINAVVSANDGLGQSVIAALKSAKVPAKKVPTTGQDATEQGMQNILQGFQCMSVYKPIYDEAEAAVALATYMRAGEKPPSSLVNGTTTDSQQHKQVPSVLLVPISVNAKNMNDTVIKDGFISASQLCAAVSQAVCTQNGIKS